MSTKIGKKLVGLIIIANKLDIDNGLYSPTNLQIKPDNYIRSSTYFLGYLYLNKG